MSGEGRTNAGGGGSGGILTVIAPAGATVTISKDSKTYTKTANADGAAVFKGLSTGTWSVMIKDGEKEAGPWEVGVIADYSITVNFFQGIIETIYPAGSTCTCTDGTTTLTAPDTSGNHTFVVPNAGTWTVSCTDGTETASEDVSITTDGQSESVTLKYIPEGSLYYHGDECTDVTGGWIDTYENDLKYTVATKNADHFLFDTGITTSDLITKNKIDLTNVSALTFVVAAGASFDSSLNTSQMSINVIAKTNKPVYTSNIIANVDVTKSGTHSLDVSSISGAYYVLVAAGYNVTAKVTDIRMVY